MGGDGDDTLTTYYVDADGDGFGNPDQKVQLAQAAPGFVTVAGDCDDLDPDVNPDALEICDEVDNDCDGVVDAGPCGDNAVCQGEGEDIACVCDEGYEGDPDSCELIPWTKVSVGGRRVFGDTNDFHACGIRGGRLYCWGHNVYGQLGSPGSSTMTPRRVGNHDDWTDVSAGGAYTCGIRARQLYCWGSNRDAAKYGDSFYGILGLGDDFDDVASVEEPTRVGTASDWVSVSAGTHHACGIRGNSSGERTLWCWGTGGPDGEAVGSGVDERSNVPIQEATESTDWVSVSAGARAHTCGIRASGENEQTLWCWGICLNAWTATSTPAQVGSETDWQAVSMGARALCGIRSNGDTRSAHCVGTAVHGELGHGTDEDSSSFVDVAGDNEGWTNISSSQGFACGIRAGDLYCWGRNRDYELGLGEDAGALDDCSQHTDHVDCAVPQLVSPPRSWVSVSTGPGYGCAIDATGGLYCWGTPPGGRVLAEPTPVEVR